PHRCAPSRCAAGCVRLAIPPAIAACRAPSRPVAPLASAPLPIPFPAPPSILPAAFFPCPIPLLAPPTPRRNFRVPSFPAASPRAAVAVKPCARPPQSTLRSSAARRIPRSIAAQTSSPVPRAAPPRVPATPGNPAATAPAVPKLARLPFPPPHAIAPPAHVRAAHRPRASAPLPRPHEAGQFPLAPMRIVIRCAAIRASVPAGLLRLPVLPKPSARDSKFLQASENSCADCRAPSVRPVPRSPPHKRCVISSENILPQAPAARGIPLDGPADPALPPASAGRRPLPAQQDSICSASPRKTWRVRPSRRATAKFRRAPDRTIPPPRIPIHRAKIVRSRLHTFRAPRRNPPAILPREMRRQEYPHCARRSH